MLNSAAFFLVGWLLVLLMTPLLIRLAKRGVGLDYQDAFRKKHDGEISRLGGVPIFLAYAMAMVGVVLLLPKGGADWSDVMLVTSLFFLLGLVDDVRPLGARVKLLGQLLIAVLAYAIGLRIELLTYPGGNFVLTLGWWSFPATLLWIMAIPNLINLIDGFDGLASGIGIFLFATLGVVSLGAEDFAIAGLCFAMVGGLLAFLHFNFPPARIFMGDGGAYLIGAVIATVSLESSQKGSVAAALLVTVVALGLPILDATLAILRRAMQGFPVMLGDRGHLHHRLERVGFSKRRSVLSLYAICVVCSLVALSILWTQGRTLPIAAGALVVLAIFVIRYFGFGQSFAQVHSKLDFTLRRRKDVQYAQLQGRLLLLEVQRCEDGATFWKVFTLGLHRAGLEVRSEDARGEGFVLSVPSAKGLSLYCRDAEASLDYAQRMAELFRPALSAAIAKWPELKRRLRTENAPAVSAAGDPLNTR